MKMPRISKCSFPGCKDVNPARSFHEIPSNSELRQKWLDNIFSDFENNSQQKINIADKMLVCSAHFLPEDFRNTTSGRKLLKTNAVPRIFMTASSNNLALAVIKDDPDFIPLQITTLTTLPKAYADTLPLPNDTCVKIETGSKHELDLLKKENKLLKMKIRALNQQNKRKNIRLQKMQEKLDKSFAEIFAIIKNDSINNKSRALILMDQIINYNKKRPTWSEMTVRLCKMWRISSPEGYEFGRRNILTLPSRRTLHKIIGTTTKNENIKNFIKIRLLTKSASLKNSVKISN